MRDVFRDPSPWEEGVHFGQSRAFAAAFGLVAFATWTRGEETASVLFGVVAVLCSLDAVRQWRKDGRR